MTILDNLKKYFKENTIEQIQKDWDNTKVYDGIDSPKVGELVKLFSMHFVSNNEVTVCSVMGCNKPQCKESKLYCTYHHNDLY